jgi:hypothetical protein
VRRPFACTRNCLDVLYGAGDIVRVVMPSHLPKLLARGQGLVVVALPMVVILARVLNLEALNVHSAFNHHLGEQAVQLADLLAASLDKVGEPGAARSYAFRRSSGAPDPQAEVA